MLNDMADIKCSNKHLKNLLIFRNQKWAANTNKFEKVAEEMNERAAADGQKNTITHLQVKNKFKRVFSQCKPVSLSYRKTTGISRYQVEKGYVKW